MKNPIIFTDFHHASLLNSFIMLFEGRLGGQVYRPIGVDWAEKGYWKVYDHPATVEQFLGIGGATPDGTPPLNELVGEITIKQSVEPVYLCRDIEGNKTNKAISFSKFLELPINIVIASIPQHIEPFKRLCELHPNKPKLIFQIGNAWTVDAGLAPNIMASAIINDVPKDINFISYHQEFDDKKCFFPHPPDDCSYCRTKPQYGIYSFVNCFGISDHFAADWQLFKEIERQMAGYAFRSFGGQCRDGSKDGSYAVANAMRDAKFIWHTKAGGDGYGHVLHNSAAVGRPTIVNKSYYYGKMGEPLLIDGVTCIDINGLGVSEIIDKILFYSDPYRYRIMCENVYNNYKEVVNFDEEAKQINQFLDNLK